MKVKEQVSKAHLNGSKRASFSVLSSLLVISFMLLASKSLRYIPPGTSKAEGGVRSRVVQGMNGAYSCVTKGMSVSYLNDKHSNRCSLGASLQVFTVCGR